VNAVVIGVSADPVKKQGKFAQKHALPYPLLSDEQHAVSEAYGVWKEKSFMGRKYMGIDRATFVIDKDGVLRQVFPKVSIAGHTDEVLAAVKALG
jgi:thioredoxin-dependent peroxiredoxin